MSVAERSAGEKAKQGGIGETIKVIIQALLIALVFRTFLYHPFNIPSGSMEPTLLIGDYLFVSKFSYGYSRYSFPIDLSFIDGRIWEGVPARGDIAVFKLPKDNSTDYIKRIIGLPGDRITFNGGDVYLNGERLSESYVDGSITFCSDSPNCDIGVIPEGYVFVLGDNRLHSSDSRFFGLVDVDDIIGQAVFANWPLDAIGPVAGGNYDE